MFARLIPSPLLSLRKPQPLNETYLDQPIKNHNTMSTILILYSSLFSSLVLSFLFFFLLALNTNIPCNLFACYIYCLSSPNKTKFHKDLHLFLFV